MKIIPSEINIESLDIVFIPFTNQTKKQKLHISIVHSNSNSSQSEITTSF